MIISIFRFYYGQPFSKAYIAFSLVLILLMPLILNGQITFEKVIGHTNDEYGRSVLQTIDSGYIICGTISDIPFNNDDVYIVKTDASGNVQWSENYGGAWEDHGYSIYKTSDSGYIISGEYNTTPGNMIPNAYLLKIDLNGDTLWTRKFAGLGTANARCAIETDDGDYVLCGFTTSEGNRDTYLVKTSESGVTIWSKILSAASDDWFYDIKQTSDGGYIISGTTIIETGNSDFYIFKTDASGDTLWTRHYGSPGNDMAYSVIQNIDGSFFVGGLSYREQGSSLLDILIMKLNNQGDHIWTKYYGSDEWDLGGAIDFSGNNEIIVCGWTWGFGASYSDIYLFKIDLDGNMIWSKTMGGDAYEEGYSVHQTYDDGYILCGYSTSFGNGNRDVYLIKTDSEGLTDINEGYYITLPRSLIYPNPSHGLFNMYLTEGENDLQIYNQLGQLVYETNIYSVGSVSITSIEIINLQKDIYFIRIIDSSGNVTVQKLIIN